MLLSRTMNCSSLQGASRWLSGKESAHHAGDAGDTGSVFGSGRAPGGGHGNPLRYSCLGNLMDRGGWQPEVYGVAQSWTRLKRLGSSSSSSSSSSRPGLGLSCVSVAQLCLILCDPMDCNPPGSSIHGGSPGKNTGVGCHALLQGIFPAQGSNLHLL